MKKVVEWIRNLKMISKIRIIIVWLSVFIVLIGAIVYFSLGKIGIGGKDYDEIIMGKDLTADILPPPEYVVESYLTAMEYVMTEDETVREEKVEYIAELKEEYNERHEYWISCQEQGLLSDELCAAFLDTSYTAAMEFYEIFDDEVVPAVTGGNEETIDAAVVSLQTAYEKHRSAIDETVTLAGEWAAQTETEAEKDSVLYKILVLFIILLSIILGAVISKIISKTITGQIKKVNDIMTEVAGGNLQVSIPDTMKTKDEFGELSEYIEKTLFTLNMYNSYINEIAQILKIMSSGVLHFELKNEYDGEFGKVKTGLVDISESLRRALKQIALSSDTLFENSSKLYTMMNELSDGATSQAGVVEELTASISEVDQFMAENASNAENASEKVNEIRNNINESQKQMLDLVSAMDDIREVSTKIAEISHTVAGIANQTNLLSLNASIEAARAGEAGKGFAVVASEIRKLSEESTSAAQDTEKLISDIVNVIENGVLLTGRTEESLKDVIEGAKTINVDMKQMAEETKRQSQSLSEITKGVEEIANVAEENTKSSLQGTEFCGHLKEEADSLNQLVHQFEIE